MTTTRRTFLKQATSTAAVLFSGLPAGWTGAAYADDSPVGPGEAERARFIEFAKRRLAADA